MKYPLPEIRHDHESFEALAGLHAQTKDCYLEEIEIDLSETAYFEADMCAALGAILYRLGRQLNTVRLVGVTGEVAETLSKNGFLSHYGRAKLPDSWGAAVSYRRFDVRDDHHFSGYIERELIDRPGLPEMPPGLVKKFRESIFEIFSNAVLHSDTRLGIFSCGQYFPELERFDFMVTDLGVGMRRDIHEARSRIHINVLVVSEFINAYARREWRSRRPDIRDFKYFRRSEDFESLAADIAHDVKLVTSQCEHVPSGFDTLRIDEMMSAYGGAIPISTTR